MPEPFSFRLRQGLSLAALFPPDELALWLQSRRQLSPDSPLEAFVRRALFLDLVTLELSPSLRHPAGVLQAAPRRPVIERSGVREYAPHRPDFASWERVGAERAGRILGAHRRLPCEHPRVFAAGALDQVTGNWRGFCEAWSSQSPALLEALRARDRSGLADAFGGDIAVEAEPWAPAAGRASFLSLWGIAVAAVALLRDDRAVQKAYELRRLGPGSVQEINHLAGALLSLPGEGAGPLLDEVARFSAALLQRPLAEVARLPHPRLLSLEEPCSWVAGCYLAVVTNPSHNPLCIPVRDWLRSRFPGARWQGWPERRTVPLSSIFPGHPGRVEWQFAARCEDGGAVLAEVKSITANNWGNKSKELYDRCQETRRAASRAGARPLTLIGVLDGDLDAGAVAELRSGQGYDEVYSIGEVLGIAAGDV